MGRWTWCVGLAGAVACAERAAEAPPVEYGESPTAIVVALWVSDSTRDAEFVKATDTTRNLRLGRSQSWRLGEGQVGTSPQPERPDYYRVFPGESGGVADVTPGAEPRQYDVYAAVILDPALAESTLRSAAAIHAASRQKFRMGEAWTFDSIPGGAALRDQVNLTGMEELVFFQNPDGTYPRVLLIAMNVTAPLRQHMRR